MLLARGMGHCGAVAVCLQIAGCSLQSFDGLSGGGSGAGSGGGGGLLNEAGRGGDAGGAPGGRGGAGPAAGAAGADGNGGARTGGAAGEGNPGGNGGSPASSGGGSGSTGSSPPQDAGTALNVLPDPSFTLGHASWVPGWQQFGATALSDAPGEGRDGSQCLLAAGRTQTYQGPSIDLTTFVVGGEVYRAEAWVRTSATTTQTVSISIKTTCNGASDAYNQVVTELVESEEWHLLSGELTAATCALVEYRLYIEGPASGVDIYVDDVGLYRVQ